MSTGIFGLQTTISNSVRISGIGVHSGKPATIVLQPGEADQGILFERYENGKRISSFKAVADNVGPTALCTVLGLQNHCERWIRLECSGGDCFRFDETVQTISRDQLCPLFSFFLGFAAGSTIGTSGPAPPSRRRC